jgi:hypothetical protein
LRSVRRATRRRRGGRKLTRLVVAVNGILFSEALAAEERLTRPRFRASKVPAGKTIWAADRQVAENLRFRSVEPFDTQT